MNEAVALKPWHRPTLTRNRSGILNKFRGGGPQRSILHDIDGVSVRELLETYGTPLYVISERRLRENVRRLQRAFMTRYPKVRYAWSYKTNYLNAVCNILHQEGAWAEVVSAFEYQKARALGVPGSRILFNGPCKRRTILAQAVAEGARIHIDNQDELYLLDEVAHEAGQVVEVAIRLNFETGFAEPWSRFGFNVESGQALDAARRIGSSANMRLRGLHSHIGTFILERKAYGAQVRIMCEFMEEAEAQTGCDIESIDIGGGFASRNSMHGVYLPPEQVVPDLEEYAEVICNTLLQATRGRAAQGRDRPMLILESGRAVVDDAGYLISTVIANKRLPDGRCAAVVDAGVNLLFTAFWYNHEVRPTRTLHGMPEETVLYGPMCMNIDVLRASVMLPPLDVGEPLVFSPVGAYNNTQWLQFIEYRPNVVLVQGNGLVSVVRRAEDLAVINGQEHLPEHLQSPFPHGLPD